MKKDPNIFLEHILESIQEVEHYTQGLSKKDFLKSKMVQDAAIRRLEIIGEAVRNIPLSLRIQHRDIPWKSIAGTRDILIHHYFGVDLDLVWQVIRKKLPVLKKQVTRILDQRKK